MECAPGRHVEQARRLAGDRAEPVALSGEPRQALHQADRVRVPRVREDREDVAHLDDAACVHDDHAVAELCDEAEIVRDQDRGGMRLLLRRLEHLDHLSLDRHVERRRRLVGDQELRLVRDRHRDHRALPHAARELVRVLRVAPRRVRDADELEQLDHPLPHLVALQLRPVGRDRLRELVADSEHRIERGHRILEDHRDVVAANLTQLLRRHLQQVAAVEDGLPARDLSGRLRDQPEQRHHADALARPRLADDAEHLAGEDVVADAVDGVHDPVFGRELDHEIPDGQDRLRHGSAAGSGRARRAGRRR